MAKTISGHRWHPDKKHCSFPNIDGTIEKILKVFEGEEIHTDPTLKADIPSPSKTSISHCEHFIPYKRGESFPNDSACH
jgi:hypothetical protein